MARYTRKAKLFPEIYATPKAIGPVRSIRQFDDKILARYWDFLNADDYYHRAASARVVDKIAVPTLILRAQDDPFIRLLPETRAKLLANPCITLSRPVTAATVAIFPATPATRFTGLRRR